MTQLTTWTRAILLRGLGPFPFGKIWRHSHELKNILPYYEWSQTGTKFSSFEIVKN
jgi:hypothetical protein